MKFSNYQPKQFKSRKVTVNLHEPYLTNKEKTPYILLQLPFQGSELFQEQLLAALFEVGISIEQMRSPGLLRLTIPLDPDDPDNRELNEKYVNLAAEVGLAAGNCGYEVTHRTIHF